MKVGFIYNKTEIVCSLKVTIWHKNTEVGIFKEEIKAVYGSYRSVKNGIEKLVLVSSSNIRPSDKVGGVRTCINGPEKGVPKNNINVILNIEAINIDGIKEVYKVSFDNSYDAVHYRGIQQKSICGGYFTVWHLINIKESKMEKTHLYRCEMSLQLLKLY